MGSFSVWHWLIVLVVILILFGAGKLPKVAGDLAQGIKNFKRGMSDNKDDPAHPASTTKPLEGGSGERTTGAPDVTKDKMA